MTQHPNSNTKLPVKEKLRHVDVVGSIIFLGTICCLLLALTWGGQKYPWRSSQIIGLFVGFGLLTILFSCWTWRQGDATLIPLRILRKRSIMMGALTLFGLGMVMNVVSFLVPTLIAQVCGILIAPTNTQIHIPTSMATTFLFFFKLSRASRLL